MPRGTSKQDIDKIRDSFFDVRNSFSDFEKILKLRLVTEKEGWIMNRMAKEIAKSYSHSVINEDMLDAQIHYYINYVRVWVDSKDFFVKIKKLFVVIATQ